MVEPERGINIDWRERVGIHADSRLVVAPADDLPGALMLEARNDQAIREKSPDFSTYGSAMSPSKNTGVKGVPLELAGTDGCVGEANLTVTVRLRFGAAGSPSSTSTCHIGKPVSRSLACTRLSPEDLSKSIIGVTSDTRNAPKENTWSCPIWSHLGMDIAEPFEWVELDDYLT